MLKHREQGDHIELATQSCDIVLGDILVQNIQTKSLPGKLTLHGIGFGPRDSQPSVRSDLQNLAGPATDVQPRIRPRFNRFEYVVHLWGSDIVKTVLQHVIVSVELS